MFDSLRLQQDNSLSENIRTSGDFIQKTLENLKWFTVKLDGI
jgi:hypothetical protein